MTEHTDDIQTTIRVAKAIEEDIREYKSIDVHAAYVKTWQRLKDTPDRHPFLYYMFRVASILLLPLLISTATLSYLYIRQSRQINTVSYLEASSAPGIVTKVMLPDSSCVWLNAGSTLRYPSRFTAQERVVQLRGEGYFEVQSDQAYPFYVSLYNGMQVKAHGTKFNVNAYEEDQLLESTLERGKIDIIAGNQVIALKPNEHITYNKEEKRFIVSTVNIDEKTAWKEGRLVFRNATLEEVVKQLSRRYNVDIVLHKKTQKNYKFRATFATENITQILDYLRLAAPIEWSFSKTEQQQDYTYPRQRIDVVLK